MKSLSTFNFVTTMRAAFSIAGCGERPSEPQLAAEEAHTAITTEKLEPYECGMITRLHTYQPASAFLATLSHVTPLRGNHG